MNDNEYLGALVMAALGHRKAVSIQECISNPIYEVQAYNACVGMVCWESEFHYAPNPIMCLESALTALGIALPERGKWHPCNREDPTTWPEEGRALVLTIKRLGLDRETVRGFLSNETFMYPYGYRLHSSIQILAWMYDTLPEPYQEATP